MQNFDNSKSYEQYKDLFLTEKKLGEYLKLIFPNYEFIHNKAFPGTLYRPDYRNDELKLIVEFDGDRHYTKAKVIIDDIIKEEIYKKAGYKVVRLPNFIQLNTKVIKFLFNIDYNFDQIFPHGFISKEVTLPADFCQLGIERFKKDLEYFYMCKNDILDSLLNKINYFSCKELVIPSNFNNDIEIIKVINYAKDKNILISDLRFVEACRFFDEELLEDLSYDLQERLEDDKNYYKYIENLVKTSNYFFGLKYDDFEFINDTLKLYESRIENIMNNYSNQSEEAVNDDLEELGTIFSTIDLIEENIKNKEFPTLNF
jgi:very-short-patch-repair endonuclease